MNAKIFNTILKSLVLYRNTIELPIETIVLEQTIELEQPHCQPERYYPEKAGQVGTLEGWLAQIRSFVNK